MKTKLVLALVIIGFAVALTTSATALSDNEANEVNVTVGQNLRLDVSPNQLAYSSVTPGSYESSSDNSYNGLEIENVGSRNITHIWVESTEPSSRPFGSGAGGAYDAGNLIQFKVSAEAGAKSTSQFHYVGRREYNESNTLSYVKTRSGESGFRYGRFRTGNEEFFWAINETDQGSTGENSCGGNDASLFHMGWDPHSKSTLGSTDFTDSSQYVLYNISQAGPDNLGRVDNVDIRVSGGNRTYDVFTWCGGVAGSKTNDTFVTFRKHDVEDAFNTGSDYSTNSGGLQYLLSSSNIATASSLQPGEHFTVSTRVSVPYGVAEGDVKQGTLTFYADDS